MKNVNIFFILLSVLFFYSCKKEEEIVDINQQLNLDNGKLLLQGISNLRTTEIKRNAYTTLSGDERLQYWVAKLNNQLEVPSYSTQQKDLLAELKQQLTSEIFKKGDKRVIFFTVWFPNWINRCERHFTDIQIYNIAYSLEELTFKKNKSGTPVLTLAGGESGGETSCICALHSRFTCPSYTLGWPPSVTWGTCTKVNACVAQTSGCGALTDQDCDGDHCPEDG